jgi:hypothetical protein
MGSKTDGGRWMEVMVHKTPASAPSKLKYLSFRIFSITIARLSIIVGNKSMT